MARFISMSIVFIKGVDLVNFTFSARTLGNGFCASEENLYKFLILGSRNFETGAEGAGLDAGAADSRYTLKMLGHPF